MDPLHLDVTFVSEEPAASRRTERRRFLGEELSPEPEPSRTPWLVQVGLGGGPRVELGDDGSIPPRFSGVLPLRHGVTSRGAPATCLLDAHGLAWLRERDGVRAAEEVECAACRAWRATRGEAARRATPPVLDRLRAALDEVFHRAA